MVLSHDIMWMLTHCWSTIKQYWCYLLTLRASIWHRVGSPGNYYNNKVDLNGWTLVAYFEGPSLVAAWVSTIRCMLMGLRDFNDASFNICRHNSTIQKGAVSDSLIIRKVTFIKSLKGKILRFFLVYLRIMQGHIWSINPQSLGTSILVFQPTIYRRNLH